MCMALFVPCSVSGMDMTAVLITCTVLSFHACWHLDTKGSFKTQRQDNNMHILPILLRSVLFWLFISPYVVYVLTYVPLLAIEHLKTVLFPNISQPCLVLVLWCAIVGGTNVHPEPGKQPRCLQVSLYSILKLNP